jgi:ankyrin repeat protein
MGNELLRQTRAFLTGLPDTSRSLPLAEVLHHQVDAFLRADPRVVAMLPTKDGDARHVIAREHYFVDWNGAVACARFVDPRFEAAADAIVDGDLPLLQHLLAVDPTLAHARSAYGHRATLLHHVAANGIEVSRQWQSPSNAPEIARALLDAGAEVDATASMYGCDTALTLLVSSSHPAEAGVQATLVDVLAAAGADLDRDGGSPLWTAIVWGYTAAVDRLVAKGARIDNLVFAAAANDLDRVRELLASSSPVLRFGSIELDPTHALEYATIYAAGLGRRDAVALLLQQGPDLTFREPIYKNTAADAARYPHPAAGRPSGSSDVLALLLG